MKYVIRSRRSGFVFHYSIRWEEVSSTVKTPDKSPSVPESSSCEKSAANKPPPTHMNVDLLRKSLKIFLKIQS